MDLHRGTLEMRRVTKLEKRIASDALRAAPLVCIGACPNCVAFRDLEACRYRRVSARAAAYLIQVRRVSVAKSLSPATR